MLTLLLLAVCAVGFAEDQTYTLDYPLNKSAGGTGFWNTDKSVTTMSATFNDVEWTLVSDSYFMGYTAANGQQLGSATSPLHHATVSTEGIEGVVKSVTVTARCKDGSTSTVGVKVGGVDYKTADTETAPALTKDNTAYAFTADKPSSGKIEVVFDQADDAKAAAINLISVVVVYDPDATDAEPANWSYEWNKTKANGGEGFYNFGSTTYDYEMPFHEVINGVEWYTQAEGTNKYAMIATGGQTISGGATKVEFWTEALYGKVSDVTVTARVNKDENAGYVTVSVNGVTYLCSGAEKADLSATATAYKFEAPAAGAAKGKILITLYQTSETKGTLYLKKLDINYLKETPSTPVVTKPAKPEIARTGTYTNDYLFQDEAVTITTETEGATIYYTLDKIDEANPKNPATSEARQEYTEPVMITTSTLIRAVAFKDDVYSDVAERTFHMYKNPQLFFTLYPAEATVAVGFEGKFEVDNPHELDLSNMEWSTEDPSVATVDADGTVHAVGEGTTNVNFWYNGNDAYTEMGGTLKLTVEPAKEYSKGTYTHVWNKGRNDGGEGFYNFGSTAIDSNTFTESLSGVNWTATTVGSQKIAFTANSGQAFGAGTGDPCSHIELVTDDLAGEITSVKVVAKKGTTSADLSNAALKVSVGGTAYVDGTLTEVPLTGEEVEYTFVPSAKPLQGEVKIEVNQDSETQVVIYFRSIVIDYQEEVTGIAAPAASVEAGSFDEPQTVALTAEEGATIYYTTDGSNPKTSATAQTYSEPIAIAETTTVKAVAKVGDSYGEVATFQYAIRKDPELSFEQEEKTVEYTDDWIIGVYLNNPYNVQPVRYEVSDETLAYVDKFGDIMVARDGEVIITAIFDGNDEYKPAEASYKLIVTPLEPLETPVVTPAGGTFAEPVEVTITAGSDWGTRAITLWYSTEAESVEEMEDDYELRTVWPEAPGFDYATNSITLTIEKTCKLIVEARGYDSLMSEPVVLDFVIDPSIATGISNLDLQRALADKKVYNLQGQRVSSVTRGVYIIDGKKITVK